MQLTELAIKRPAMMSMVFLLFVFLGLVSAPYLGVDLYPPVNIPYVTVVIPYAGAGPEEIETQVVKPVEDAVSSINNVKNINSRAAEGLAMVTIEFTMNTDLDEAAIDVQKNIDAVSGDLPDSADRPVVKKVDFNAQPVMVLAVSGDRPLEDIYELARDNVKDKIQQVPGVGEVSLNGGREREVKIAVDKNRLETYGVALGTIIARVSAANMDVPAGRIDQEESEYLVRILGEYDDLDEIRSLAIPLPTGGKVALRELATVSPGTKDIRSYSRYNGKDAVTITILKQSTASLVATADAISATLPGIRDSLPPGIQLYVAQDGADFVHNALNETWKNLIEGILTTALVLLLFLREWRSTLIVVLAIPTSLIATLTLMYFAGFSFNLLTLLALTMCIGILVDDSIVVLENIHRHRTELGKDAATAAMDGRTEIGMAAVAITMSDVVVFGPIAFLTGIVGQFFKQFGLTVVFATLFSLLVSFTLTPMLASLLFKNAPKPREDQEAKNQSGRWSSIQHQVYMKYETFLKWALSHRRPVVITCLLAPMLVFSFIPLGLIKTEFMPLTDQSQVTISLEMPPGTSLAETDAILAQLEKRAMSLPETETVYSTVGKNAEFVGTTVSAQQGNVFVRLVPKTDRKLYQWEIAESMRSWGRNIPGAKISVFEPSGLFPQMAPIQVNITGNDQTKLVELSDKIRTIVKDTPGTADVDSSWKMGQPEIQAEINPLAADNYGLTTAEIAGTMRSAVSGDVVTTYRKEGKETDVRVLLSGANSFDSAQLGSIGITNNQGQIVRLDQVAAIQEKVGPTEIKRMNKQRLITIKSNISGRSLGDIIGDVKNHISALEIPNGSKVSYQGESYYMEDSFAELTRALIISIFLVYAILVMLYESYLIPVIRMLSLPLGLVGALLAFFITGKTLNISSFIGLIMLDGLVAKNSTLLIDYTHTIMQREGLALREALVKAGTTRLRPIIMTSVTMIAGMLPTALAKATGAEMRSGMAAALIGGLLLSTVLTLVVIPVAYTLLDDLRRWVKKKR